MKQEETSCPKMLKVLYFPLILCYIRALFLFLPYRTQLKIGISNAKATHIQPTFKDLLLHKGCKASENAGKNNLSDCAEKTFLLNTSQQPSFLTEIKAHKMLLTKIKVHNFFADTQQLKKGKRKGKWTHPCE